MDAQIEAMMKQHGSLVTASLAAAEQMVFKARMERSAIEFDLRAAYSRIENLQARTAGLKEQHAKAIDAVNVALERQEALRTVLQPIAPWMFAVPAGDGPRAVDLVTLERFEPVVGMDPAPALGSKIGVGQFLRAKA
jgi:Na+-translocating ferredoxin:NAD+ oxidoreductase RnfC subunit